MFYILYVIVLGRREVYEFEILKNNIILVDELLT